MLEMIFQNDRDAAMRLNQSVVSHNGQPVYVIEACADNTIVEDLGGGNQRTVETNTLNLAPVQCGNVRQGDAYSYIQRAPVRRWKQGLHNENIVQSQMPWLARVEHVHNVEMKNAIMNVYPSAVEAIKDVMDGKTAVAFSRRWGVGNVEGVYKLFYKDKNVGVFEEGELIIFEKYFYLREDLLGVLNV